MMCNCYCRSCAVVLDCLAKFRQQIIVRPEVIVRLLLPRPVANLLCNRHALRIAIDPPWQSPQAPSVLVQSSVASKTLETGLEIVGKHLLVPRTRSPFVCISPS